jgi:hypothetical protein
MLLSMSPHLWARALPASASSYPSISPPAYYSPSGRAVRANMTPSMASQPSPHFPVRAFGRFDEITDLVDNAADLTLARHGDSGARARPLRCGSCPTAARPIPLHFAALIRSRTSPDFRVWSLATMSLTPVPSFGRFDEAFSALPSTYALLRAGRIMPCRYLP